MFITVLICTRNRAPELKITLESLVTSSNLSMTDWQVIVVDNNSTDGTAEICQEYRGKYPSHFSTLFEAKTGRSNALNTGIAAAKGDIIAMTDDDVSLEESYLNGIRTVFEDPSVDLVQGRVILQCPGGRPVWMDREMAYVLASRDYGEEQFEWKKDIVGANMIVRATVFQKIGGFRTDLGAGVIGFGEDTEFTWRAYKAGLHAVYAPQIVGRHRISPQRLTKSSMRRHYFVLGKSLGRYTPLPAPIWRFSLYLMKEFVLREIAALWLRLTGHPDRALHLQCDLRLQAGMLLQHWRQRKSGSLASVGVPSETPPKNS